MSRSGYTDDCDDTGTFNLYRANVDRTIAGKRGQKFLREMAAALDAMPVKELVADDIVRDEAHVCAIGAVAVALAILLPACSSGPQETPSVVPDYPGAVTVSELDAGCIPTAPSVDVGIVEGLCSFCALVGECQDRLGCWGIGGCSTIGESCGLASDQNPVGDVVCCTAQDLTLPFCP